MTYIGFGVVICFLSLASAQIDPLASRPKIQKPLGLQEAVKISLQESHVLRDASAELKADEARPQMMRSEKRWQLSVNAFASTGTQSGVLSSLSTVIPSATMLLPSRSLVDGNAIFMFPLFTGGRLTMLIRRAEAVRNATSAQLEAIRLDLMLETRIAYRQALLAREVVRVTKAYVQAMEERVGVDKMAAQAGRIPEFWVLRSEAGLANAGQVLLNAQRDYEIALLNLKTIMGIHPDSQIELTDLFEADREPIPDMECDKLIALALANRPEVRVRMQQVDAQAFALRAAKALYKPQIGLMAMSDYVKGRMGKGANGYLVGIVVGFPILDGGRRRAAVNEAQMMRGKALAELEQTKLQRRPQRKS